LCKTAVEEESAFNVSEFNALMEELRLSEIISYDTKFFISFGEPSLYSKQKDFFKSLIKYPLEIASNCTVYSESIADCLSSGRSYVNCSLDSGTAQTYLQVKGKDFFDKVRDNLRKYSTKGRIILKYIVMPGINDSEEDLNGFIDFASELKPEIVKISRNYRSMTAFDDCLLEKLAKLFVKLEGKTNIQMPYGQFDKDELVRFKSALDKIYRNKNGRV